jgi:hypothetical protein
MNTEDFDQTKNTQPLKRVLSGRTIKNSYSEDSNCKRIRIREPASTKDQDDDLFKPFFPDFAPTAPSHRRKLMQRIRNSPQFSASTQEEEVDCQLAEELFDNILSDESPQQSDPVPLLTRPSTPIVDCVSSDGQVVCEWPSNLAVDNALTAVISLRPLSPCSLMKLEEQEKEDLLTSPPMHPQKRLRAVSEISNTGLTPVLNSIKMP